MDKEKMEKNIQATEERISKYKVQKGFIEEEFNHMSEINGKHSSFTILLLISSRKKIHMNNLNNFFQLSLPFINIIV